MKEYHFGIRVTSYMFENYLQKEGRYRCHPIRTIASYGTSHLGDDIISIFIGFEQIESHTGYDDCLKAYFKTDKFRINGCHDNFDLFRARKQNGVLSIFVIDKGMVVADYPIHDLLNVGTVSFENVTISLDREKLIRNSYTKDFLSVFIDGKRLEDNAFNMPERNLMQYFFETAYAQSYNKHIADASFSELYNFLKDIDEHVASYDIPSILKDLKIHVSSFHWRDDSYDTIEESRSFSFPMQKLDKYLQIYLGGVSYYYSRSYYYSHYLSHSKKEDSFDTCYCVPITQLVWANDRCGSFLGFNAHERQKIWANEGNYNEEQVDIVRKLLIERYSPEHHKKYLLKDTIQWGDWEKSTIRRNLNGIDFLDILIDSDFFNRIDTLIGVGVKEYYSISEINEYLNKRLKDSMWLLRRDR